MITMTLLLFVFYFFSFAAGVDAPEDDNAVCLADAVLDRLDKLQTIARNTAPILHSCLMVTLLLSGLCAFFARWIAAGWKCFSCWIEKVRDEYPPWTFAVSRCVVFFNWLLEPSKIEEVHSRDLAVAAAILQESQRKISEAKQRLVTATKTAGQTVEIAERKLREAEEMLARNAAISEEMKILIATLSESVTRLQQATPSEG